MPIARTAILSFARSDSGHGEIQPNLGRRAPLFEGLRNVANPHPKGSPEPSPRVPIPKTFPALQGTPRPLPPLTTSRLARQLKRTPMESRPGLHQPIQDQPPDLTNLRVHTHRRVEPTGITIRQSIGFGVHFTWYPIQQELRPSCLELGRKLHGNHAQGLVGRHTLRDHTG